MSLPTIAKPKGRLTKREVLAAARSVNELQRLRTMVGRNIHGSITLGAQKVNTGYQATPTPPDLLLTVDEIDAIIALLIERHSVLLTGLDIELDQESL